MPVSSVSATTAAGQAAKAHKAPISKVTGFQFHRGSGIMTPSGHPRAQVGYSVTAMVNPSAKLAGQVAVNEKTKTVTITLSATATKLTQAADKEKELFIKASYPKTMNQVYKVNVQNASGKSLFKSSFMNMMPC